MATRLWDSDKEMVYTILWKEDAKKILFGTGNRGRIYSVDSDKKVSLLLQQNSEQIYQLVSADSGLFVLANNPCFLGQLRTEQRFEGEYLSPVFDAKILSSWGRIAWEAEIDSGASLQFQTRSGNTDAPDSTWSAWSPPYQRAEEQILSPKARFLQTKVRFKTQSGRISPVLNRVVLFYLQSNVAPSISRLDFLEPNEVYLKAPGMEEVIKGVERNLPDEASESNPLRIVIPDKKVKRKGFRTVVWNAADENGDRLRYALSIRKEREREWRVLQAGLREELFAFDTQSFPDGTYFLKLTASDMPSNPVGMELEFEKISRPLVIDNSLPVIKNFSAVRSGEVLNVSFSAEDSYSFIEEIKFLMRPGEWRVVFPEDGIADSRAESFKFSVKIPAGTDRLFTVRVRDSFGNIGVFRQDF
jgi:hypothetical protein